MFRRVRKRVMRAQGVLMHTVMPQAAGRNIGDVKRTLERLLDMFLIAFGGALASRLFRSDSGYSIIEGAWVVLAMAIAILLLPCFGVYESRQVRSTFRTSVKITLAWLIVQACGLAAIHLFHGTASVARFWCMSWTLITAVALVASRLLVEAVLGRVQHACRQLRTVAVVGTGAHRDSVIASIASSPAAGFRAVATYEPGSCAVCTASGIKQFRILSEFAEWVRRERIEEVWLALPIFEEGLAKQVLKEFSGDLVNLRFIPDLRGLAMFDRNVVNLIGAPAINLMASPMTPYALIQKAIFDRLFAMVALLAISPLMLLIALAVKSTSKGPVLFTQQRKGMDGRVFRIYKFRSMCVHMEAPGVVRQATRGDARVTRVGAFLRRTSLDELPQFFNVLRGEMSIVGPRPHAIEHDEQYRSVVDGYIHRYRIKPGITGWAQVNGLRGQTAQIEQMQARVEHDLYYLRNWSFGLDMRIVFETILKGLCHRNAY